MSDVTNGGAGGRVKIVRKRLASGSALGAYLARTRQLAAGAYRAWSRARTAGPAEVVLLRPGKLVSGATGE